MESNIRKNAKSFFYSFFHFMHLCINYNNSMRDHIWLNCFELPIVKPFMQYPRPNERIIPFERDWKSNGRTIRDILDETVVEKVSLMTTKNFQFNLLSIPQAKAVCAESRKVPNPCNANHPELPKYKNLHSRGANPSVKCPPGYKQTVCNARSPWTGT